MPNSTGENYPLFTQPRRLAPKVRIVSYLCGAGRCLAQTTDIHSYMYMKPILSFLCIMRGPGCRAGEGSPACGGLPGFGTGSGRWRMRRKAGLHSHVGRHNRHVGQCLAAAVRRIGRQHVPGTGQDPGRRVGRRGRNDKRLRKKNGTTSATCKAGHSSTASTNTTRAANGT